MAKVRWSEGETQFLRENYQTMEYKDIAQSLGRSLKSVQHRLTSLGLRLPPDELSRRFQKPSFAPGEVAGEKNPNWKGGISKEFYRYKRIQMERYPEHVAARKKVGEAIRQGKLKREPCEVCGCARVQAHHDDYSKPLDVRWFCKQHHDALHEAIGKGAAR